MTMLQQYKKLGYIVAEHIVLCSRGNDGHAAGCTHKESSGYPSSSLHFHQPILFTLRILLPATQSTCFIIHLSLADQGHLFRNWLLG